MIGIAQYGTVYTGGHAKIAEHGGNNPQDRSVPLVVSGAGVGTPGVIDGSVETIQIAPTILTLLGLDPRSLQAVQAEGTRALPLGGGSGLPIGVPGLPVIGQLIAFITQLLASLGIHPASQ